MSRKSKYNLSPGDKFHNLTVMEFGSGSPTKIACKRTCGTVKSISISNLVAGNTLSCGCLRSANATGMKLSHGLSRTPEYRVLMAMIARCENPNNFGYQWYGGRGIKVCEEWRHSPEAFIAHVGKRPTSKHTIDRYPDPDGNYEPGNVRWATAAEQSWNKRQRKIIAGIVYQNSKVIEFDGRRQSVADWARERGINYMTLINRIYDSWPVEEALEFSPHVKRKPIPKCDGEVAAVNP